ncbi:hypothetical protein IM40_00825 [Candidatus Paracaedimonas acanthamoebae]|nr:hypothetical protein IM40_00825 [Candidatus Paracaedimonas acanthamoebae]
MSELMLPRKPSVFNILDSLLLDKNNFPLNTYSIDKGVSLLNKTPPHSGPENPAPYNSLPSLKGNILIVGEPRIERDLIVSSLTQGGHRLLIASTSEEAFEVLSRQMIDMIINNFQASFHLLEFVKKVKSQSSFSHIPLLIASSTQEKVAQSLILGAEDFFASTLEPSLLQLRIHIWLENKAYQNFRVENLLEIRARLSLLKEAVECVDDGFAIFDPHDQLILCNQSFRNIYNLEEAEIKQGLNYQQLLEINYKRGVYLLHGRRSLKQHVELDHKYLAWLSKRLKVHTMPHKPYIDKLSNGHYIEITEKKLPEGGMIAIFKDVTEQIQYEKEVQYLATHDILTGLANRVLFKKALENILVDAQKKTLKFAVIYIDLDGFKSINDTFGHSYGDHLLTEISKRLQKCLRKSDLIARLGGDEFSILLKKVKNHATLEELIHRIQKSICIPIQYGGKTIEIGASIGIVYGLPHGLTPASLLVAADKAMYEAKRAGRNNYRFA